MENVAGEAFHGRAGTDCLTHALELSRHLFGLDRELRESGARLLLPLAGVVPLGVERLLAILHARKEKLRGIGLTAELHPFEERLDDVFAATGHCHGDPEVALDRFVFAKEDVENNAVDLVVDTEERDDANLRARLAEAVDSPFPLVVAGGIPREVVVDDRIEVGLEIDPFTEAVGADEQPLGMFRELRDPVLTLLRGKRAGDRGNFHPLENAPQLGGDVVGGVDEAAEHNRLIAILDELLGESDELLELDVFVAEELLRFAGEVSQPNGGRLPVGEDIRSRSAVEQFGGVVVPLVKDCLPADLIDRFGVGIVAGRRGHGGLGTFSKGGSGGRRAGGHRP